MPVPTNLRITCKLCQRSDRLSEFKDSCDNEGCKIIMARRRGRNNKPAPIKFPVTHAANCICERCLDSDTTQLERELEKAWEVYNKEEGVALPNIIAKVHESPVEGPYEHRDVENARFVNCPVGIVGIITPKGRRRK